MSRLKKIFYQGIHFVCFPSGNLSYLCLYEIWKSGNTLFGGLHPAC